MHQEFPNALINPHFELQDYGTALRNATAYVANRWRLVRTGAAGAITSQLGVTNSSVNIAKWARSRACMDMVVTAASYNPATDTGVLRQRVPDADHYGNMTACLRVAVFGPDGGSFEIGFNAGLNQRRFRRVYTEGNTTGGTPILGAGSEYELRAQLTELVGTTLDVEVFANPSDVDGTYKIVYAQLEFLMDGEQPGPFRYSPPWLERLRCAPYIWKCPKNHDVIGLAGGLTAAVIVGFDSPMSATPTVVNGVGVGSVDFRSQITGAVVSTSTAPSPAVDASGNIGPYGGRIGLSAFTGLSSGQAGFLGTDAPFLLEAELG